MWKRLFCATGCLLVVSLVQSTTATSVEAAPPEQPPSWGQFDKSPYAFRTFYPSNRMRPPGRYSHLYYRYPTEAQIPIYRKDWINFAPPVREYNPGHRMVLDVF